MTGRMRRERIRRYAWLARDLGRDDIAEELERLDARAEILEHPLSSLALKRLVVTAREDGTPAAIDQALERLAVALIKRRETIKGRESLAVSWKPGDATEPDIADGICILVDAMCERKFSVSDSLRVCINLLARIGHRRTERKKPDAWNAAAAMDAANWDDEKNKPTLPPLTVAKEVGLSRTRITQLRRDRKYLDHVAMLRRVKG